MIFERSSFPPRFASCSRPEVVKRPCLLLHYPFWHDCFFSILIVVSFYNGLWFDRLHYHSNYTFIIRETSAKGLFNITNIPLKYHHTGRLGHDRKVPLFYFPTLFLLFFMRSERWVSPLSRLFLIAFDCHFSRYEPEVSYISCIITARWNDACPPLKTITLPACLVQSCSLPSSS